MIEEVTWWRKREKRERERESWIESNGRIKEWKNWMRKISIERKSENLNWTERKNLSRLFLLILLFSFIEFVLFNIPFSNLDRIFQLDLLIHSKKTSVNTLIILRNNWQSKIIYSNKGKCKIKKQKIVFHEKYISAEK